MYLLFRDGGLWFRVYILGFGYTNLSVRGSGFRVWGLGFRAKGLGFRVKVKRLRC